jgi:hypothetical protein
MDRVFIKQLYCRAMSIGGGGIFGMPSFVLQFQGENWGDDMRVIYLNDKTLEYPY